MRFSMILAMDGNESQRRNGSNHADQREFSSELYIPSTEVDSYAHEVNRRKAVSTSLPS